MGFDTKLKFTFLFILGGICVSTLVNQFGIKMIKFTCESQGPTTNSSNTLGVLQQCVQEADAKAVDAFQILMAGGRTFPTKKTSRYFKE